jgi:ribosomal protein S18 acetylase RimI-like enzyme
VAFDLKSGDAADSNTVANRAAQMNAALGRFTCLFVAELNGEPIGFLAGSIKTLPRYFGGFLIGFISEVFVVPKYRRGEIGRRLMANATDWFAAQRVKRIELQVLMDNGGARKLYQEIGWKEELVQMVFPLQSK